MVENSFHPFSVPPQLEKKPTFMSPENGCCMWRKKKMGEKEGMGRERILLIFFKKN